MGEQKDHIEHLISTVGNFIGDHGSSLTAMGRKCLPLKQALPSASRQFEAMQWRPIADAPYDEDVEVRVGEMTFMAILSRNASLTADMKECDQWQAARESEHPPCWSGGACWRSNEDEAVSLQPDAWRPLHAQ